MSTAATASPSRIGSIHFGKSASLTANTKTILSEQHQRLWAKHTYDLDLIDDLRTFIKVKCHIEKDYCNAIIKLVTNHQSKKYPQFKVETESDIKSLYTVWKQYMEDLDKVSKQRLNEFEQIASACETLKQMKTHKAQIGKKAIDLHLKKMQEEVIASISEIEKNKKSYFDEENFAKQARDKEEKMKKRKGGIFSKFTDLQSKKEKSSAQREASDIQSTQARNEYIMSLVAGNAHLNHYYSIDLPNLMRQLDDDVLDKCRGFVNSLLQGEINSINIASETMEKLSQLLDATSGDITNSAFLSEPTSACLRETLQIDFEPCENDPIMSISKENNAELALQHEITKWSACYTKECRNLNRLSQQLIKCQTMLAGGHKTVEVTGVGQVDIESRIDDIKQQLRKCDISKVKAEARLIAIRDCGMQVDDLNHIESQITTEMKQSSLDVDVAPLPLSRTPSVRSNKENEGGRYSSMEAKSFSDEQNDYQPSPTPEPGEVITHLEVGESPEPEQSATYQYESYEASWNDYDPTAAWNDTDATTNPAEENGVENDAQYNEVTPNGEEVTNEYSYEDYANGIVGKTCQALYDYDSQNDDELNFKAGELLRILSASDKDWVTAQNDKNEVGFVPAAFMQVVDETVTTTHENLQQNESNAAAVVDYEEDKNVDVSSVQVSVEPEITDEYVRAVYDYTATSDEEISFQTGDLIKILERSDDGWWLGEKDGIIGHFPSMLVHELTEAENEEAAFEESESAESGNGSPEYVTSPSGPPPPSFAPPKPAYLTPNQVVIIQPTPEIERREFCDRESSQNGDEQIDESIDQEEMIETETAEQNQEFVLERPRRKSSEEKFDEEPERQFESSVTVTVTQESVEEIEEEYYVEDEKEGTAVANDDVDAESSIAESNETVKERKEELSEIKEENASEAFHLVYDTITAYKTMLLNSYY
ncbi:SH3 domain containing protein 5-like protein [Dinothrombium tinctorium]|uniref:SH3 domain containing protein 5-like protein n=1 Tax=Dinothrombium tinctorium TaxID=1965070 RepID=A0A3S4RKH9_9ACAR|nr:SH3 domain containing protein 5-like protein [Dinothrombium tinctorium]